MHPPPEKPIEDLENSLSPTWEELWERHKKEKSRIVEALSVSAKSLNALLIIREKLNCIK